MDLSPSMQPDPRWSTAVPDWGDRIREGRSLLPDLPLFDAPAEKALRVFKELRIPDMLGTPTYGEVSEQWVFDYVRAIFGCYDPEAKRRIIQEFLLLVPKKNTKSAIAAAIIVTAAILNERPQAELWLIGPTQKISGKLFKHASGIIRLDSELMGLFQIKTHKNEIFHRVTEAEISVVSADSDTVTGCKAAYVVVDEAHVLGSKIKAADIYLEIRGGLSSRPEGFFLQITTQSKKRPVGQFKNELNKARAVRDGEIQAPLLSLLFEFPDDVLENEGWRDQSTWAMVNPNLERSVALEYLIDKFQTAERDGADAIALFASQHLNVQIGAGLVQDRWAGAALWAQSADPSLDLESLLERSEVVVVGIDGGGMDDLLGLSVVGRCKKTRRWLCWFRAWAHPIALERRQSIAAELNDLIEGGDLVLCDHPTQDVDDIVEIVVQIDQAGLLPEQDGIGLDPEGVAAILDALIEAEIDSGQMRGVSQGYRLNGAIKGTERKLFDGSMLHSGQALMTWCVSNAKTEQRGNATMVTKAASGVGKIDPLMALFNSVTLMSLNPQATCQDMSAFLANPVMVV